MTTVNKLYRQGDVLLVEINVDDNKLENVPQDARGLVLAEGESSGHYHAVFGRNARLCNYKESGMRVVVVDNDGADVRVIGGGIEGVDRHTPISLKPGKYEVRIQRSWTSENASLQVAD